MLKSNFINGLIVFLVVACTSQTNLKPSPTPFLENRINNFVPENITTIPSLKLSWKKYQNEYFQEYILNGIVDSMNQKQGYWTIQDIKNNLIYKGHFHNNEQNDWWEVFSMNKLICSGNYKQNKKQGYWRYLEVGENKTNKFVNYTNDTLNGLAREFTIDSVLISDGNYSKGYKNGYWKFYYSNGKIKDQGNFNDNLKIGWWQKFDLESKLLEEANYSSNEIAGFVKKYSNGILVQEGNQYKGQKKGVWKNYDMNGKPLNIEEFDEK